MRLVVEMDFAEVYGLTDFKPLSNPKASAIIDELLDPLEAEGFHFGHSQLGDSEYVITIEQWPEEQWPENLDYAVPLHLLHMLEDMLTMAGFKSPVTTVKTKPTRRRR